MKRGLVNWKLCLRILFSVIILYTFYKSGLPLYFIVLFGLIILLLILLKGTLYKKLDNFLGRTFPFLSKLKPWVKKLIIIAVFVLVYMILKQIIFLVLKQFGVDVQQMITNSINQSIEK
jgi:hypothetical protein